VLAPIVAVIAWPIFEPVGVGPLLSARLFRRFQLGAAKGCGHGGHRSRREDGAVTTLDSDAFDPTATTIGHIHVLDSAPIDVDALDPTAWDRRIRILTCTWFVPFRQRHGRVTALRMLFDPHCHFTDFCRDSRPLTDPARVGSCSSGSTASATIRAGSIAFE
jgi:hypothetical protein